MTTPTTSTASVSPLPRRFIFNDADLHAFLESPTKIDFMKFITASGQSCASSVVDCMDYNPEQPLCHLSPGLATLLGCLEGMKRWLKEIPPVSSTMEGVMVRFGNPAFRSWHERMTTRAPTMMQCILETTREYTSAVDEHDEYDMQLLQTCHERGVLAAGSSSSSSSLSDHQETVDSSGGGGGGGGDVPNVITQQVHQLCAHLNDAFGHPIRLDYGTGHESSFQIVLYVLFQLGTYGNPPTRAPSKKRLKAATLAVWHAYLCLTRGIQKEYRLEPAGSHGVWGLDDYYCLPFYYGAQQLVPSDDVPSDIFRTTKDGKRYLYYSCIDFIQEIKTKAPFHETSPMLHDISHLPSWTKVAAGLLKLYHGEVLEKRPVVQHWVFGQYFPTTWTPSQREQRPAPEGTFRDSTRDPMPPQSTQLPPTRAPWAK